MKENELDQLPNEDFIGKEYRNERYDYDGESFATAADRLAAIDTALSNNGGAGYQSPLANILKGIKIFGQGPQMAPMSEDVIGWSFINRPLLNLSDNNVSKSPKLVTLTNPVKDSLQHYVKALLDNSFAKTSSSGLVNPLNPWMCPLTNMLKSSGGFPDLDLEIEMSSPGIRQEVYQHVNGFLEHNGPLSITQTYNNVKPSIIPYIFEVWEDYISEVKLGDKGMSPYWEALYQRYIDYDCRIYHFIMNKNGVNIEGMYMTVQSIPTTYPAGTYSEINNDADSRRGNALDEISITFSSTGFRFNIWDVAESFNLCTLYFNEHMSAANRPNSYTKLKPSQLLQWQYYAIPWINIDKMEMEWYIPKSVYDRTYGTTS